jgi:plastocyanin
MDETGWSLFLRPDHPYTVEVYLCCVDPSAQVTLEVGGQTVILTDLDDDGWYKGGFTTPLSLSGVLRLCVTCDQIKRCSQGEVLIDPEGTVYDLETRQEIEGATVACYEAQSGGGGETYYDLWPAEDFMQENPQTTGADGYYSFFTPAGTYQVQVTADGYQGHVSPDLVVTDEPVEYDVYLAPEVSESPAYTITVSSMGFDPPVLVAPIGAVVAWVNVDSELHASTSVTPTLHGSMGSGMGTTDLGSQDAWDSGLLESGQSYVHQLTGMGTYTYQDGDDAVHTGRVIVQPTIYLPVVLKQY